MSEGRRDKPVAARDEAHVHLAGAPRGRPKGRLIDDDYFCRLLVRRRARRPLRLRMARRAVYVALASVLGALGCRAEVANTSTADASIDVRDPPIDDGGAVVVVEDGGFGCTPPGHIYPPDVCPTVPSCDSPVGTVSLSGSLGGETLLARGAGSYETVPACSQSGCFWTVWVTLTESPWTCGLVNAGMRPKSTKTIQVRLEAHISRDGGPALLDPPIGTYVASPESTIRLTLSSYDNSCQGTAAFDEYVAGTFTIDESYPVLRGAFAVRTNGGDVLDAQFSAPSYGSNLGSAYGCCPN